MTTRVVSYCRNTSLTSTDSVVIYGQTSNVSKQATPHTITSMKRFADCVSTETLEEERDAMRADMKHLQQQAERYGPEDDASMEDGGVKGLLLREKKRLFGIYHSM
jgi:hypothetical protein